MKDACRFYSLLLSLKQHHALQAVSRKEGVSLAELIRKGIELVLENSKTKKSVITRE